MFNVQRLMNFPVNRSRNLVIKNNSGLVSDVESDSDIISFERCLEIKL